MKFLAALPLVFFAVSCYYAPYDPGYPPYYGGGAYGPSRPLPPYGGPGPDGPLPPERGFETRPAPRQDDERPEPPRQSRPSYPVAEKTGKPDQVISPYAPYNVIDVRGFKSGQLAKDPSNGKIFRVP